ncbi:TRAP transporter substrate-binding protein [Desulfospira joergensenii]|uniref:TRAP transporter substrate-binding protein n=1 Tax=Desulfospira joergensenii TaxID=53329 RepID=UPI0003B5A5DE|nr:TRAP transporter substrate-binding protein [Desulfospira joergensenii]
MKKPFFKILIFVLGLSVVFCGPALAAKKYKIKLGHTAAPTHHYQDICLEFAKIVAQKTDGNVEISVFPANQLGKQLESVEGCMYGTHDMVLTSDTVLSNWVPDMGILNLPFLFNDMWEVRKVLDGPVGDKLAKQMEPLGAVVIGWWDNGMRHITNSKRPIKTPEDLDGLKIRVPEGEVFVDTFKALNAGPTVISFGELYSALQLGTVDGQENPPAHILTQKFYEVQKYVSRTGHIHLSSPLVMNKALLDSMPTEYQKAILDTAREMGPIHTQMVEDLEKQQWIDVAKNGMEVIDVEKKPFQDKVQPVIEKYKKKLNAEIITEIIDTLKK